MVPVLVGASVALILGYLGVSDVRAPWTSKDAVGPTVGVSQPPGDVGDASTYPPRGALAPVLVKSIGNEGVSVSWVGSSNPELDNYTVDLYAVSPVDAGWNIAIQEASSGVSRNVYPWTEFDSQPWHKDRPPADEVWRVCVTAMKKTPLYVDVTPYIIKGSKACSEDFQVPSG